MGEIRLRRTVSLPLLVLYGVGTMVGGGFYALVGRVAGLAGLHAPLAILLSGVLALLAALCFAELSSRYPYSAGESEYVRRAFRSRWLPVLVGWMVIATGVVSAATLAVAVQTFVSDHFEWNRALVIVATVLLLGAVAAWGIGESVLVTVIITLVEVGGLLFVLAVAAKGFTTLPGRLSEMAPPADPSQWLGIASGAFLVFYAFIGFEDMVNLAEEVRAPRRTLPRGILLSLGVTLALYVLVILAAVLSLPVSRLAEAKTPLAEVVVATTGGGHAAMSVVSVLAGLNGALVQVIMASRVAYGMSDRGLGPRVLAKVSPRTRTPLPATGLATGIVLALALWLPLQLLAEATSTVILLVFALVSLSLVVIQRRERRDRGRPAQRRKHGEPPADPEGASARQPDRGRDDRETDAGEHETDDGPTFRLPAWIPVAAFLASLAFVAFRLARLLG